MAVISLIFFQFAVEVNKLILIKRTIPNLIITLSIKSNKVAKKRPSKHRELII